MHSGASLWASLVLAPAALAFGNSRTVLPLRTLQPPYVLKSTEPVIPIAS